MTQVLIVAVLGKLLIYVAQKFLLARDLKFKFLRDLAQCQLCLGVWVYSFLCATTGTNLFGEYFYFPVVAELISGVCFSYVMWLMTMGWHSYYDVIVID